MQEFKVPSSKSISNRLLIIKYLSKSDKAIKNLSLADDTILMQNILSQIDRNPSKLIFTDNAGTVTRFIISLLAIKHGVWQIDADPQMRKRPIKPLLDALKDLGAEINHLERNDKLPIQIIGGKLIGGKTIKIESNKSSQFLSSLLQISPYIKDGLSIQIDEDMVSKPYLKMTIALMKEFGAKIKEEENHLIISPSKYNFKETQVENDYSSACFAFEKLSILKGEDLFIKNLYPNSLQADSIAISYFSHFGIKSEFENDGLRLSYNEENTSKEKTLEFDIKDCPDIFPSLVMSALFSEKKVVFKGIESLEYKESNRIHAMKGGLNKIGAKVIIEEDRFIIDGFLTKEFLNKPILIKTYDDHRIAMTFAIAALKFPNIQLDNKDCVSKSFPMFWENL
ncbi:MAG: 3-phosphoshikimate 1-carboxyvinyltransferase [Bacteroidales bacterium]|nr:3-phosphoshikimate 1-carboxyvinyltransferase [Bacteroidales bacterium]